MTAIIPKTTTLQVFLQRTDIDEAPAWEFNQGEVTRKPMGGGKYSRLQKKLVSAVDRAESRYEAFPGLRCTVGDRSVVPDIVVLAAARIPLDETGEIVSAGIEFAPDWAIEILSPRQNQTRVTGNILHCLQQGSLLGWLIDPEIRSVLIYWPNRSPEICTNDDLLPVLPDLELTLSADQLFSWLRLR